MLKRVSNQEMQVQKQKDIIVGYLNKRPPHKSMQDVAICFTRLSPDARVPRPLAATDQRW